MTPLTKPPCDLVYNRGARVRLNLGEELVFDTGGRQDVGYASYDRRRRETTVSDNQGMGSTQLRKKQGQLV
jgi:hypothetical protein